MQKRNGVMKMTNDEKAEMIAEINGNQRYCKNCDDCCKPYNSADDCFKSAMEMAEWKEKQMIDKACDAYCKICDTQECLNEGDCNWVKKFRKAMEEK